MAPSFRFLNLFKNFQGTIPEVEDPDRKILPKEKILWTSMALFIYMVCSQIPLYGSNITSMGGGGGNPLRMLLASNAGTLMALGTSPLITSSMITQLLAGAKMIDVDLTLKEDRSMFNAMTKVFGVLFCAAEAVAFVLSGQYGAMSEIGAVNCLLLILQLGCASLIVLLLDEMLSKGYGLTNTGMSLFITVNICETIIWKLLSPATINTGTGVQFEGALIAFFHLLFSRSDKWFALQEALYRPQAPNMMNFLGTIMVFLLVIYLQAFRVELHTKYQRHRGAMGTYPVKLFYTATIPMILVTTLVQNLSFISQIVFRRFRSNMIVRWLGEWQEVEGGNFIPVGGIMYYLSPPNGVADLWVDPLHMLTYVGFMLTACATMSYLYLSVSGTGPRDVAKQFRDQGVLFQGYRDTSIVSVLNQHIPTAAMFGGMCIGMLSIVGDFLGVIGTSSSLLIAVQVTYGYAEVLEKEGYLGGVFGRFS